MIGNVQSVKTSEELLKNWTFQNCQRFSSYTLNGTNMRWFSFRFVFFVYWQFVYRFRFHVDLDGCGQLVNSTKKQINISFPLVGLNMSKHIAPSAKASNKSKEMYNLYGVSNHYGTLTAGHYTAFCKSRLFQKWVEQNKNLFVVSLLNSFRFSRWFKFDDKKVTQLDQSGVVTSAAYILFYTNETGLLLSWYASL